MSDETTRVVWDGERGYRRLDPLPDQSGIDRFYEDGYAENTGGSAPDIRRLKEGAAAADVERRWRYETAYSDLLDELGGLGLVGGHALDVGAGTGELLRYLSSRSGDRWTCEGVEPDARSTAMAVSDGLVISGRRLGDLDDRDAGTFDLVTLLNVLEHVIDPRQELQLVRRLIGDAGYLVVQVPNDFSTLQEVASTALGLDPWWIAIPDHVNYFDFESIESLLRQAGFEPVSRMGTFPMEFFLLAGINYVSDPELGAEAHRRRREIELALPGERRRAFAKALAAAGIGRNCLVIARPR